MKKIAEIYYNDDKNVQDSKKHDFGCVCDNTGKS